MTPPRPGTDGVSPAGWHRTLLLDLGKSLASDYHGEPELLSLPYLSDLKRWKDAGKLAGAGDQDDGGLYTGETVLHIAVANQDLDTVRWLLRRGAWLSTRATGAFFKARMMQRTARELGVRTQLIAWLQNRDLEGEPFMHHQENVESGDLRCGETVLAFAATAGKITVLEEIVVQVKRRLERLQLPEFGKFGTYTDLASFLNEADSEGNTALHYAVSPKP